MRGRRVQSLGELLAKYATLEAPQGTVVEAVREAVRVVVGVTLTPSQVSYTPTSKVVHIALAGPQKQEIIMRKKAIFAHLHRVLSEKSVPRAIT